MSIPVDELSALLFSITHRFPGILDLLHSLGKLAYRLLSGFLKESSNALKLFNHHLLIMLGVEDVKCPISACVYILKENGAHNYVLPKVSFLLEDKLPRICPTPK